MSERLSGWQLVDLGHDALQWRCCGFSFKEAVDKAVAYYPDMPAADRKTVEDTLTALYNR